MKQQACPRNRLFDRITPRTSMRASMAVDGPHGAGIPNFPKFGKALRGKKGTPDRIKLYAHSEGIVAAKSSLNGGNTPHRPPNRTRSILRNLFGRKQSNFPAFYLDPHGATFPRACRCPRALELWSVGRVIRPITSANSRESGPLRGGDLHHSTSSADQNRSRCGYSADCSAALLTWQLCCFCLRSKRDYQLPSASQGT